MFSVFTANTLHKLKKNDYQKEEKRTKKTKQNYKTMIHHCHRPTRLPLRNQGRKSILKLFIFKGAVQ